MSYAEQVLLQSLSNLSLRPSASCTPCTVDLRQLPQVVLGRILVHLSNKDIFSLAATCRNLHQWSCWAYRTIHFELGEGAVNKLVQAVTSLEKLAKVLQQRPQYQGYVITLSLYDSERDLTSPGAAPPGHYSNLVAVMDAYLGQVVCYAQNLLHFFFDASTVGANFALPRTIEALAHACQLEVVALVNATASPVDLANACLAESKNLRQVSVHSQVDIRWAEMFLRNQSKIRRLQLTQGERPDTWLETLAESSMVWSALEDLSIMCRGDDVLNFFNVITHCVTARAWTGLTSLSLAADFPFEQLAMLAQVPLRRLRLVVNVRGTYLPDFGPGMIGGVLAYLPSLEEIILDHYKMTEYVPVLGPELLGAWCDCIRNASHIRKLVIPTYFAIDPESPLDDEEDEGWSLNGEDGESEASDEENVGMSEYTEETQDRTRAVLRCLPVLSESMAGIYEHIVMFAEEFFDDHLRSLNLQELRLLHDNPNTCNRESIGFEQATDIFTTREGIERLGFLSRRIGGKYDMFWEHARKDTI
ncbi:uncharacterized protein FIBRA_08160 [Fibroporia radiculosa]|uniref:F-box domain-containing protein n=1 Tax=Fibroporia radiculosa TaxID=599839 RepID=J4I2A7_9APHY|nr:uncharacterized protein FIBRA_08160 [Fibroporia radiculosa]CCM05922.1 predicted protein [Fibroporia radiculosa]